MKAWSAQEATELGESKLSRMDIGRAGVAQGVLEGADAVVSKIGGMGKSLKEFADIVEKSNVIQRDQLGLVKKLTDAHDYLNKTYTGLTNIIESGGTVPADVAAMMPGMKAAIDRASPQIGRLAAKEEQVRYGETAVVSGRIPGRWGALFGTDRTSETIDRKS